MFESEWESFQEWSTEKDGSVEHMRGIKRALEQRENIVRTERSSKTHVSPPDKGFLFFG